MDIIQSQQAFFNHIKSLLPAHLSMVDEIAELLGISNDSAYRRIRGDKPIGLDEIQKLCRHYKLSLDQLLQLNSDTVIFSAQLDDERAYNFNIYLKGILGKLQLIHSLPQCEFYCFNKDIPMFYFMQFPVLSAFKFFCWKRTLMNYPDLLKQQFSGIEPDTEVMETGKKIIETYVKIPSTEILNEEMVLVTLKQIKFYREANLFENNEVLAKVYNELEQLINHLEVQAEKGIKFIVNENPNALSAQNNIYINETLLGTNNIYVKSGERQLTIINHSGINFMTTQDQHFCDYIYNDLRSIIRKSTHISVTGEKERNIIFSSLRYMIKEWKGNIAN
ncbi:MAG: helix-turn-helix domain-containing protein [Ferruginibacter sp.]